MHYQRWAKHGDPLRNKNDDSSETDLYISEVAIPYKGNDCLIWPFSTNTKGYARIVREGKTIIVSRLICEEIYGPAPTPKHHAAHSCGRGHDACINPNHVGWKTKAGNEADKLSHGTSNRGSRNGQSKMNEEDVIAIRSSSKEASELASLYGVTKRHIVQIQRRISWNWLPD